MADAARELPSPAAAKAYTAEQATGWLRLAVITFGVVAYWTLWFPRGHPPLAGVISAVALAYGLYDAIGQPYRHFPALATSAWTATTDAVLITLWLHATGDAASPFYPLWYLSLVAVAFRYDWFATLAASVLYVALYVGLAAFTGGFPAHAAEMVLRCGYLLLLGALAAVLARASTRLFEERAALAQRVVAAEAREKAVAAESELRRLQEVNAFKTDFINTAAHELNTPLTPLILQTHMLQKAGASPEDRARIVDVLQRNLARLSNLVQDMLDVARLQSGRLRLEASETDLARVLRDTVQNFEEAARGRGLSLALRSDGPIPCHADRRRIGQVMDNLVSNAVKFTPPGGHIEVAGQCEGDQVVLRVTDTGVGLTPEKAKRLFQPFTRVHQSELERPGTGLGLYICRGIVESHGGTIGVESAGPGQGAVFTVRLPIAPPPPAASAPGEPSPQA